MKTYVAPIELAAKAICLACDERPDAKGDARGNAFRWQDYVSVAEAAIKALSHDGVLVRLGRPDGYEDVHPDLVAEDAIRAEWTRYEVLTQDEDPAHHMPGHSGQGHS